MDAHSLTMIINASPGQVQNSCYLQVGSPIYLFQTGSGEAVEWFREHGGLKRESGDRFRATLLSRRGTTDAMALFRNFTGRDPDVGPLLKRRGLLD